MRMKFPWVIAGTLGLLVFLPQSVYSQQVVYRCVHPNGLVEYRASAVFGLDCSLVERWGTGAGREQTADPVADPLRDIADPVADPSMDIDAGFDDDWAEQQDLRVENCAIARRNLALLEAEGPVIAGEIDGEPVFLDEAERSEMIRQTLREVAYWCDDD